MSNLKSNLAILSVALCTTTSVFAADLPSKNYYNQPQNSYVQPSNFTWTGFYAGLNLGYAWSDVDQNIYNHGFVTLPSSYSKDGDAFTFGVQAGYNHQLNNDFVIGGEIGFNFGDMKSKKGGDFLYNYAGRAGSYSYDVGTRIKWLGTLRGRAGFLPTERLMLFGTGGLAFADVKTGATDLAVEGINVWNGAGSNSDVRWGWTIGAGAEYALTENISAKLEYSYVDLSDDTNRVGAGVIAPNSNGFDIKDDPSFQLIRAGLNYKF